MRTELPPNSIESAARSRGRKPGRPAHRIELPRTAVNPDAVRSFVREFLVPLLAEDFLAQREGSPSREHVISSKPTSCPVPGRTGH